ncbi:uncharacterized protein LOC141660221 [Apium graveolens]|uniref:uncharacterized protein LOC141660221 n=1 Tax=Apium graveolens TaxID=4045 RepID=UPI003D7A7A67
MKALPNSGGLAWAPSWALASLISLGSKIVVPGWGYLGLLEVVGLSICLNLLPFLCDEGHSGDSLSSLILLFILIYVRKSFSLINFEVGELVDRLLKPFDKLGERLFAPLLDSFQVAHLQFVHAIVRPYGVWMCVELSRKNHTIGAKWLRHGGGISMNFPAEDKTGNNTSGEADINVTVTRDPKNSGIEVQQKMVVDKERFTFERGRDTEGWMEIQLDRALTNGVRLPKFPMAKLYTLEGAGSDHSPILLIVKNGWNGNVTLNIQQKIQACSDKLGARGKDITGDFFGRIKRCKSDMRRYHGGRDTDSKKRFAEAKKSLIFILNQREVFWRQRAKQLWLQAGDKNSKYFHASPSKRRRNNQIHKLLKDDGQWCDWESGLNEFVFSYFENLFTASEPNWHKVIDFISRTISVGSDIMDLVKKFFRDRELNVGLNSTKIVLANRLKDTLESVISPNQSGFMQGRLIYDNVMVSYQVMYYLKRKRRGKGGSMALKIDMSKEYDRIEWGYLEVVLLKMGYNDLWVYLIMQRVRSVTYNIRLSPLIRSYLYFRAYEEEANRLLQLLQLFENASGQGQFGNIFDLMPGVLHMEEAGEDSKYLGLPNMMNRNKMQILGYLKDKVKNIILNWDGILVSQGGKEVLIKSVAQTLPTYAMSVFLLPLEITKDIKRIISKFWWNSKGSDSKVIHWMSWDRLSRYKSSRGMGFRDFRDFNLAMLEASLGNNPSFIWRSIMEAKKVVAEGVRWRVGSGSEINIIGQTWLLDEKNPYITSNSPTVLDNKASSLMFMDGRSWDEEILNDLFNARDQCCIRNIPIAESNEADSLYWYKELLDIIQFAVHKDCCRTIKKFGDKGIIAVSGGRFGS